jgi:hypothetical protein
MLLFDGDTRLNDKANHEADEAEAVHSKFQDARAAAAYLRAR